MWVAQTFFFLLMAGNIEINIALFSTVFSFFYKSKSDIHSQGFNFKVSQCFKKDQKILWSGTDGLKEINSTLKKKFFSKDMRFLNSKYVDLVFESLKCSSSPHFCYDCTIFLILDHCGGRENYLKIKIFTKKVTQF